MFSQQDIPKNNYVILTEKQARANLKELAEYDALKLISAHQVERINVLGDIINNYDKIIFFKDSIIEEQRRFIDYSLEDTKKLRLGFHTYVGVETYNIIINRTNIYYRAVLELNNKYNLGVKLNFRPADIEHFSNFYYNLHLEIKLN